MEVSIKWMDGSNAIYTEKKNQKQYASCADKGFVS